MKTGLKRAKDVMRRRVVRVRPELLVSELVALFEARGISGAPVVDGAGGLVGVVSKTDLVRHQGDGERLRVRGHAPEYYDSEEIPAGFHVESPDRTRVRDIMTPVVISSSEETPVPLLARLMLAKHVHRVLITRQGRLSGIVTSMDLLRLVSASRGPRR